MSTTPQHGTTSYEMRTDTELVYTRVFNAPREVVFAMFTEADHLTNWLGMPDDTMKVVEQDLREGGAFRWEFYRGDELQVTVRGDFVQLDQEEFIEHTEIMEFGGITTPAARCTQTFTEQNGQTTVVATIEFPDAESAKMALESGMKDGIDIGFGRLDAKLADRS